MRYLRNLLIGGDALRINLIYSKQENDDIAWKNMRDSKIPTSANSFYRNS